MCVQYIRIIQRARGDVSERSHELIQSLSVNDTWRCVIHNYGDKICPKKSSSFCVSAHPHAHAVFPKKSMACGGCAQSIRRIVFLGRIILHSDCGLHSVT